MGAHVSIHIFLRKTALRSKTQRSLHPSHRHSHSYVLERVVHEATFARVVTFRGGAVHELLFREHDKVVVGNLPRTLGRAGGGERPA